MTSIWKAMALVALPAALLFGAGCVSSRAFMPAEHVTGLSPRGNNLAAEYPLVENGQTVGEVKVWSGGASRDSSDDDPRTRVRVGFELINHGDGPLRFDAEQLYLEELPDKSGAPAGRVPAVDVSGDAVVSPGQRAHLEASFALPSSVWPRDVPGFRVAWTVAGQRPHSRKTPFLRLVEARPVDPWYPYYAPYYGYYYPGFYGPWAPRYRYWPSPWRVRRYYYLP